MTLRVLTVDPTKCTGCRICELGCSFEKERVVNPARARIGIITWFKRGYSVPIVCLHCDHPVCADVCPTNALVRDQDTGAVVIDRNRCIGCRLCVTACPLGAIFIDPETSEVIKCDLCDGSPVCAELCPTEAILYLEPSEANQLRMREAAQATVEILERSRLAQG